MPTPKRDARRYIDLKDRNALLDYARALDAVTTTRTLERILKGGDDGTPVENAQKIHQWPKAWNTTFFEARHFGAEALRQTDALTQFAKHVQNGVMALQEVAGTFYTRYTEAERKAQAALQRLDRDLIHDRLSDPIPDYRTGAAYDSHGWDLRDVHLSSITQGTTIAKGSGLPAPGVADAYGPSDSIASTAMAPAGTTDWRKDADVPGTILFRVWSVVPAEPVHYLNLLAQQWAALGAQFTAIQAHVTKVSNTLKQGWDSAAADVFQQRVTESALAMEYWAANSQHRSTQFFGLIYDATKANREINDLYAIAVREIHEMHNRRNQIIDRGIVDETNPIYVAGESYTSEANFYTFFNDHVSDRYRKYDTLAAPIAEAFARAYVQATPWTAPARYPGLLTDTPSSALPPVPDPRQSRTTAPSVPGGGGGGGPSIGGGGVGKPPGIGSRQDPQKIIDGQKKAYDKSIANLKKDYDKSIADLKKTYEDALKQERNNADQLQNQMQQQQEQSQKAIDELAKQVDTPAPQLPDVSVPQLPDTGGLPLLPGLPGIATPPTLPNGLGGGGIGGLKGSSISAGLPTATGAVDLMGRGGTPAATTAAGAALTGRAGTTGSGLGGVPFIPGAGVPQQGGGGGSALSGRKGRPMLPEEKQKPVTRPRVVDPEGDGTTDTRPARDTDRRASVTRPPRAPEVEPGQALGRTA
ncbi:hypothetical protein GCM10010399_71430 [Dactylosporangium fulvum]|uniref:PPE family domain-containing protein n=1 Tax=Dactylosporangium fulvum TaxID=53359 RepID=A0ABY5VZF3_9ACTN|nr:hypothetical protein [Dactylosporangium fulvum]UWP82184.1 hypothetical protein Dfulv_45160 [Dactylosporangium fulvum]